MYPYPNNIHPYPNNVYPNNVYPNNVYPYPNDYTPLAMLAFFDIDNKYAFVRGYWFCNFILAIISIIIIITRTKYLDLDLDEHPFSKHKNNNMLHIFIIFLICIIVPVIIYSITYILLTNKVLSSNIGHIFSIFTLIIPIIFSILILINYPTK